PLAHQPAGDDDGQQDQRPRSDQRQSQWQAIALGGVPATPGGGGDFPRSRWQDNRGGNGILSAEIGAEETGAAAASGILTGYGYVDCKGWISQPAIGIEPVHIDHGRDNAPEFAAGIAMDIDG